MKLPATAARKRPKKPKLPPSIKPWPCSILAIDPGERSGWSIWAHGLLECWGECDLLGDDPQRVLSKLLSYAGPHIVVVERPFKTRYGTQMAVGAGDLVWRRLAERAGLARRVVRVWPSSWRARVLGKGWANAKRDAVRNREQTVATGIVYGIPGVASDPPLGADEAAAILIGAWSIYAGEVGAKLPKGRKRKAAA